MDFQCQNFGTKPTDGITTEQKTGAKAVNGRCNPPPQRTSCKDIPSGVIQTRQSASPNIKSRSPLRRTTFHMMEDDITIIPSEQ